LELFENLDLKRTDHAAIARQIFNQLIRTVDINPLQHKHPGFSEEQEVRVVPQFNRRFQPSEKAYYTKGNYLVPYVVLNIDEGDLGICDQIVIGPGIDYEKAKFGIESLAASKGRRIGFVVDSQIPFDPGS
jgi:hypothetical protein